MANEWENSVITMTIHKMMEVLEQLNKEDELSYMDVEKAAHASEVIAKLMVAKQQMAK